MGILIRLTGGDWVLAEEGAQDAFAHVTRLYVWSRKWRSRCGAWSE